MQDVCNILKTRKVFTTPFHPQCDGVVERYNKTLINQLSRLAYNEPDEWEKFLPFALFAYRATPHDTTKETPFFLVHGRQPNFQIDNIVARQMTLPLDYDSYRFFLSSTLQETQKIVLENVKKAQEKQKRYYDLKTKQRDFKIDDLVAVEVQPKFKLDKRFIGPFKIIAMDIPNTAVLADPHDQNRIIRVSLSRIKFWYESAINRTVL